MEGQKKWRRYLSCSNTSTLKVNSCRTSDVFPLCLLHAPAPMILLTRLFWMNTTPNAKYARINSLLAWTPRMRMPNCVGLSLARANTSAVTGVLRKWLVPAGMVAARRNGSIVWNAEKDAFCPSDPQFDRRLISLLSRSIPVLAKRDPIG